MSGRLPRYRVLTGPDDAAFCHRVSAALAEGYALHGGPALTCSQARGVIVAQALVWAGEGDPPTVPLQPEARPAPDAPVMPTAR
ncbi:DUF1737 domain-containing protein [Tsukamurella pulmonis]|uniref:DUF1737 domain-containing protein n=1 Tax=Tsukamurella pulmonis TaxID=47312 RepID=UPI001A9F099E|nr:DUF1737 domain-containing protein [Tsukamurella pulmonis]